MTSSLFSQLSRRSVLLSATGGAVIAAAAPLIAVEAQAAVMVGSFDATKIRALAFDMQGSVLDYYTPLMQAGARINKAKGLTLDWAAISSDWRDTYHDIMVPVLAHKEPYVPTDKVYRRGLDTVLDKHGVSAKFTPEERDALSAVWGQMVPWPDSREGLRRLRRRYMLSTLSNSGMATVAKMVKHGNLPFDVILTGELAQNYKPDPAVYQLPVDKLGYAKSEIMMCACHKYDLKAAKEFGFSTAFWPRPAEFGPATVVDDKPETYIDIRAKNLTDLATKLGL